MKDYNINVNFNDGTIESDFMELVENDYNSTKLNFKFDIDERIVLKILYPDGTIAYVNDIVNNEYVFQEGLLSQDGEYQMELAAYDGTGRLTNYETMAFYVRPELVSTDEIVEPDDRVPILDNLINEVENLDLDATKSDDIATITIKKKDGTIKTVEIRDGIDGIGLNYNWVSTSLGIKREDEQEYQYVNLKGDKGDAGAIKMVIVNELPQTGSDDTIYLVPNDDPETGNNYDEYVYINNAWEKLGGIQVEVDLTDYVKNTDYATDSTGGVVKSNNYYNGLVSNAGTLYCSVNTYQGYQSKDNASFISKGTLENVITGKGLVSNIDYASSNVGGVVKVNSNYGTAMANGYIIGDERSYAGYNQMSNYGLIGKGTLENVITGKDLTTKAYVDNAIASAITDALGGSY